ncbi:lysophospholipid acyltransferase family protein [Pseudobacteriovorax antillogorgiicola]|uniref:DUF374 domain-containing protein n=1 Tax=Pseudobacteriovorax antillogorgiicola TaxID=1513793 RepID=A0A1Y6C3F7_9BACT|nr:lysophospholipid acyltransferase family protein [Pseudobacteriovorax antillogorgiicola]TCS50658.1 hypothetical protein EDD56_11240 [Pseudobacteriovorax antillogorgiicola]SMF39818.1 hypothetical protein SAMN06296036_11239 [Pseudobacteriovorax antillogorgiicola]
MKTVKRWLLLRISFFLCWLFHKSYRYELVQSYNFDRAKALTSKQNYAIASWHNNCFAGILSHAKHKICLLVSRSFDGEFVAFLARMIGMTSVRGSSSRGGKEALKGLIDEVNKGWSAAITVDGPRGPVKVVKSGIITLASRTGTPIQPLCTVGEKQWVLHKSWDQFRIPKPFSRVAVVYGEPLMVPRDLNDQEFESVRRQVHESLEDLERVADDYFAASQKQPVPAKQQSA